ncbi:transporter substrate-binding domain-containing protein [Mitsuaria sp. 7]|uniref:transporter substrate-binding domain-containing protein n=1 Tax=Mitsuaria sp. 7 TaxID=1658665 RepID=UPI0008348C66|nr:transporter substrate-binding domain-containing protein [Mitsuaria sp. 7]
MFREKTVHPTRRQFVAGAAATIAAGAAPLVGAQPSESTLSRVRRTGSLRLGVVPGAVPYAVKDLVSGEYQGFCIDLGRDLARHLQVDVTWVDTSWGNAILDLRTDKVDAHFGLAPTAQRRQAVDFTEPLFNNMNSVVARKGLQFQTWADIDRPGVTVAVDVGSSHDQLATRLLKQADVRRFDSIAAATLAVQSGRADCQILAILLSTALVAKRPDIGHLVLPTPYDTAPSCIGVRQQSDPRFVQVLNAWIAEARASGRVRAALVANMHRLAKVSVDSFPPQVRI